MGSLLQNNKHLNSASINWIKGRREFVSPVGKLQCYDIEVDHPDHLFVLGNGMIVSNSKKHSSGSASGPNLTSGFEKVKLLASVPKTFKDKAVIAEEDGIVTAIKPASQGGSHIQVGTKEYYALSGFDPLVKVGDKVEQGDILSAGIPNPAEVTKLRGIGEGRKFFTDIMKQTFDEGGMGGVSRRNFEVLAKSILDNVHITNNEGLQGHLPGSITSYQNIAKDYIPRADSETIRPDHSLGKYLEQPILHLTIGTKLTSKLVELLKKHKIDSIIVNSKPPGFEPAMQRLDAGPLFEDDWMHQLYSTSLAGKLSHAVNTGMASDLRGPSPISGLSYGKGFGLKGDNY